MRPLKPIIEFHGPMADHNMPCALCNTGSAVLVMPGARVPSKETSVVDNTTMVEISCYD
jgi:hypothetical protein